MQKADVYGNLSLKNVQEPVAMTLLAALLFIGNSVFHVEVVVLGVIVLVGIQLTALLGTLQLHDPKDRQFGGHCFAGVWRDE